MTRFVIALALATTAAWGGEERLVVTGGPAAANVAVKLNGSDPIDVGEGQVLALDIGKRLRTGINELDIELRPRPSALPGTAPLAVSLTRSPGMSGPASALEFPLVDVSVAARSPSEPCRERVRFWVGPPTVPPATLAQRYWLVVSGPPIGRRVTVVVNDAPLFVASEGYGFVEITSHVRPGPNAATFTAAPACFADAAVPGATLQLVVATGREEGDGLAFDVPALLTVEVPPASDAKTFERALSFQAR
jgi:hypothetical protein